MSTFASQIDVAVDEKQHLNHVVDSLDLLIYVSLLILTIVTLWCFKERRVRFLHESGLAVIYGLVVGFLLRLIGSKREVSSISVQEHQVEPPDGHSTNRDSVTPVVTPAVTPPDTVHLRINVSTGSSDRSGHVLEKVFTYGFQAEQSDIQAKATFNPEIFFYVLLPPIIFYAGYCMRRKHFFDNLGAILAFALVGTVISTFIVGIVTYAFAQLFVGETIRIKFLDTLFFGAIVSATDPVTVLAIFQDLHVDATLNGLILGESLLNDAVAIVLCSSIEEYVRISLAGGTDFETDALLLTVVKFFCVVLGSVGLGALVAALTAILTKFTRLSEHPLLETSLFTLMSYTSYLLAEISGMSGIVAVLFCGISQAHYTFHNLSPDSQLRTKQFFETLNFLAENFIFSYIGVSMFTFDRHIFSPAFIIGSFVAIALGRACNIYPLSWLVNLGRKQKLPNNFLHMMWFSGLRGAMAFALAVQNTVSPARSMFFTTTCIMAITTVIVVGSLTTPALSLLQIPVGVLEEEHEELLATDEGHDPENQPQDGAAKSYPMNQRSFAARVWSNFDRSFLKPMLTSSQPSLEETMPPCCLPLARCFTSEEQKRERQTLGVAKTSTSDSLASGD